MDRGGYKKLRNLSKRQLKRVISQAIEDAASSSSRKQLQIPSLVQTKASTNGYVSASVPETSNLSSLNQPNSDNVLHQKQCGYAEHATAFQPSCHTSENCPQNYQNSDQMQVDLIPSNTDNSLNHPCQFTAQSYQNDMSINIGQSNCHQSDTQPVLASGDSDREFEQDIDSGIDVIELLGSDEIFEDFISTCDVCDSCSSCACFLGCGNCKHSIPPSICVHCAECSKQHEQSAEVDAIVDAIFDSLPDESNSLSDDLTEWAVQNQITHASLRRLLAILNRHHPEDNLPRDSRTLLGTVRKVVLRDVPPGKYWHNGVKTNLIARFSKFEGQEICLSFNIDGLPISNSSGSALWPVLCNVIGSNDVFAAGIYHGYSKPESERVYLQELVEELADLIENGLDINGKHFHVCVRCFCCDAPAKSFVLCVKGHCGYFGCCKCTQKGRMFGHRMSFPETEIVKRTDESFVIREQPEHHLEGVPSILGVPAIKPVTDFVLDPMHLLYLGVMKKLMMFWLFGKRSVKMGSTVAAEMSKYLENLYYFTPVEFARKSRSLQFVRKFKATEFREILFYIGPVIFKDLNAKIYENFIVLHVASRLLNSAETCVTYNDYAGSLMKNFVTNFKHIYGEEFVSHNVHGCLHVHEDVLRHGPLELYSAFKFENFLQSLKGLVRKGEKPLEQIVKRYSEMEALLMKKVQKNSVMRSEQFKGEHTGPLLAGCQYPQYKVYSFKNCEVNVGHIGDCCIGLKDGSVIVAKNFAYHESGHMRVIGTKYKFKDDLYHVPINSSNIGIYKVYGESSLQSWPVDQISLKYFRMPYKAEKFAVIPFMH